MKPYTYLLIDIGCILIPFIASFYSKHAFYKSWVSFFKANLLVGLFFLVWDAVFTALGVWGFNPEYLTGLSLINLPIEEILFFLCIPYACVFTKFSFEYLIAKDPLESVNNFLLYGLILISIVFLIFGYNQLYTLFTGLFTLAFSLYLYFKRINIQYYFLTYLVILPFFFLSNGMLTGTGMEEPIVWYNDSENFGVRMLSIPIEDSIYGLLLIFMNIYLFDYFRKA